MTREDVKKATIVLCALFAMSLLIGCGEEPQKLEGQERRTFVDFLFWCFVSFWRWLGLVTILTAIGGAIGSAMWSARRRDTKSIDKLNNRIEELTREIQELRERLDNFSVLVK